MERELYDAVVYSVWGKRREDKEMTVGQRVKKLREEAKMYQYELAKKVGVAQSTISNIENNKMPAGIGAMLLTKIAYVLDTEVEYLIGGEPKELTPIEEDRAVKLNMPIETLTVSEEQDNDFCFNCIHREICNLRQAYNSLYRDVANLKTSDKFSIDVRCKHFRSKELTR